MLARLPRILALVCSVLLAAACGGTQTLEVAQGPCVEGQTSRCDCGDESIGVRRCGSDSHFGECTCPGGASGTTGGTNPTAGTTGGAAGGAGTVDPVAGTGGGGGFPPSGGAAGVSGFGGTTGGSSGMSGGVDGIGGGGGGGGFGGMTGGTSGTSGGSGGSGGTTGGSGGMAGTTGGSGGDGGPGRDPRPGELYGDCLDTGLCDDGLLCISDGSSGTPMSYCTTTCGALDQARCPRSRNGAMATCVLGICVRQSE